LAYVLAHAVCILKKENIAKAIILKHPKTGTNINLTAPLSILESINIQMRKLLLYQLNNPYMLLMH
jgi:hypothetical protein